MPISTRIVGKSFKPQSFDVSPRRVLSHAAAIGALTREHFDDATDRPPRAFPTLCFSFEYNLQARGFSSPDPTGATLDELRRAVHASQDSFFHGPIVAGQVIHATGKVVQARSLSSGAFLMSRIQLFADENPTPLVTSWVGTIYRDVRLTGEDVCLAQPEPAPSSSVDCSDDYQIQTTRTLPHVYSECAGIWNPIHTERHVARANGLPDNILHGTATLNLVVLAALARYDIEASSSIARLRCDFRGFVLPGESIHVSSGLQGSVLRFTASNTSGRPALAGGYLELRPSTQRTSDTAP